MFLETLQRVIENPLPILLAKSNTLSKTLEDYANSSQTAYHLPYTQVLLSLGMAAGLGALIAYHPRRQIEVDGPVRDRELKKTLILITVAGAVLVTLIQGSLERAFGLVGLGSFVRYRTSLRNPVDLSIIFILIGLGMACGLNYFEYAITIAGFIYVLLFILDFKGWSHGETWLLKVDTTHPALVDKVFRSMAEENRFRILRIKSSKQRGGFRCQFLCKSGLDIDHLTQDLRSRCGEEVHFSRIDWDLEKR